MSFFQQPSSSIEQTSPEEVPKSGITPAMLLQGNLNPTTSVATSTSLPAAEVSPTFVVPAQSQSTTPIAAVGIPLPPEDEGSMRFINIRYKVYTVILIILLFFAYGPVWDAYQGYLNVQTTIESKKQQVQDELAKRNKYAKYKDLLLVVEGATGTPSKKTEILTCLNTDQGCDQLPQPIVEELGSISSYLQLGTLETAKMEIDEKRILKSINEFLLQINPFDTNKKDYNGQLARISIGDPRQSVDHLYNVPVSLSVTFATKNDMLSFLANIEKRVFREVKEDSMYSLGNVVLYKIDSLSYDIMQYETAQDVQIGLTAWYYK